MRRIGHEVLLRLERLIDAREQQVEFVHQRAHLGGQAGAIDRRQVVGTPLRDLAAHALHGRERAAHGPPRGQRQQRRHERDGHGRAQRQRARHGAAHGHVLRHLDHLQRRLHRQHAVGAAARAHVGESQHGALRQRQAAVGFVDAHTVGRPDLHHEFGALLPLHQRAVVPRRQRRQAGAQGLGHLLHVVVEDRVRLGQRRTVRQARLHQHAEGDGGQQGQQQPSAQRLHGLGTMYPTPRTLSTKPAPSFLRRPWM
jgi:hypothetical protein